MKLLVQTLALCLYLAAALAAPIDDAVPLVATSSDILKLQPGVHAVHQEKEIPENKPVRQSHQLTRPAPINPEVISEPVPPTQEKTILVTPVPDVKSADWHRESGIPLSKAIPATEVEQLPKETKTEDTAKAVESKTDVEDKKRLARDLETPKEEKKAAEETKVITQEKVKEDKPKLLLSRGSAKFGANKEETTDKECTEKHEDVPEKKEQTRPSRSTPPKVEGKPETEQSKPVVDAPIIVKKIEEPKLTIDEVKRPSRNVPVKEVKESDAKQSKAALEEPQHASGHHDVSLKESEKKVEIDDPKLTVDEVKRSARKTSPKVEIAEDKKEKTIENTKVTIEEAKNPSSRPIIREDASIKKPEVKVDAELPLLSATLKHKRIVRASERRDSNDDKNKRVQNGDREQITNYPDEKYDNEGPHFSFPVPVSKILGDKAIKYSSNTKTQTEETEDAPADESSK